VLATWKAVRLYAPAVPELLARRMIMDTWRELCDSKGTWSFLRREHEILISASRSGTVNVTRASATVQGVGLAFVAADVGRQFRTTSTQPPYTILYVNPTANTASLDRVWGAATASATSGTVLDAYVTMPEGFSRFIGILDPVSGAAVDYTRTDDELNVWDPQRSTAGSDPPALYARRHSTVASTLGRIQYELYPYQLADRNYPCYYYARTEDLADDAYFPEPIRSRTDVLLHGALAKAASIPAFEDGKRNPFFSLQSVIFWEKRHKEERDRLEVVDEDIYLTWLETVPWLLGNERGYSGSYMQSHDVA